MRLALPPLLAATLIWAALALPQGAALTVPAELPVVLLALTLAGRWARLPVRAMVTAVLTLMVVLSCADLVMGQMLGRPFNLVADLPLLDALVRVVAGSFGTVVAGVAMLVIVALCLGCVLALWWATGIWSRRRVGLGWPVAASVAVVALAWMGVAGFDTTRIAASRIALTHQTIADLAQFRRAAADDPLIDATGLMGAIDRDVLVIFIESYGRTSFDTPFYADTHLPNLRQAEGVLAQAGLTMRSGFLTSATQGGQSWLSHASFANGLWIDDQSRYLAALASGRQGLFHHARRAGFRTAAVMPAITMPWPEAQRMGFDDVLAAADLGYRGQPFNWVTMPDQFTLAAADRLLRDGSDTRRLFAQIVLISSHAPWVPVPSLLDWDSLGDGRVFDHMAAAGDPPAVVWRDRDRVREHYRGSIDYVLQTVTDYARRHADDAPLMIVLGDHQAAPGIALDDRRQVPVHVIGPKALVDRTAAWGLKPGLIPPGDATPIPMQAMRDLILRGFSETAGMPPA